MAYIWKIQALWPIVKFIRYIDRIFDMLNSRSPMVHGFIEPLRLVTDLRWRTVFERTVDYPLSLKASWGQLVKHHRRETFLIGFLKTTKSTAKLDTY